MHIVTQLNALTSNTIESEVSLQEMDCMKRH